MYDETNDPENYGPVYSPNANDNLDDFEAAMDDAARYYADRDVEAFRNIFANSLESVDPKHVKAAVEFYKEASILIDRYKQADNEPAYEQEEKLSIEEMHKIIQELPLPEMTDEKYFDEGLRLAIEDVKARFKKEAEEQEKETEEMKTNNNDDVEIPF